MNANARSSFQVKLSSHLESFFLKETLISGLIAYLVVSFSKATSFWSYMTLSFLFNPPALLVGISVSLLSIPILLYRSQYASGAASSQPNNLLLLYHAMSFRTLYSMLVHSLFSTVLYNIVTSQPQSINTLIAPILFAVIYIVERAAKGRDDLTFPSLQQSQIYRLRRTVPSAFFRGVFRGASFSIVVFCGLHTIRLMSYFYIWHTRVIGIWIRQALISIGSPDLMSFVFIASVLECVHCVYEVYATEGVVNVNGADAVKLILSCKSENLSPLEKYHFHYFLFNTFKYSSEARKAVFSDVESQPIPWKVITGYLLGHIDSVSTELESIMKKKNATIAKLGKANPEKLFSLSSGKTDSHGQPHLMGTATVSPTKRGSNIIAPPKSSGFMSSVSKTLKMFSASETTESENSSGPVPGEFDRDTKKTALIADNTSETPSLLRYRGSLSKTSEAGVIASESVQPVIGNQWSKIPSTLDMIEASAKWLRQYKFGKVLLGEDLVRFTKSVFSDLQLHMWTVQALVDLTVASAHEDKYGTAHRDISLILETLARLHIAIRTYQKSLLAEYGDLASNLAPSMFNIQMTSPWNPEPASSDSMLGMDRMHFGAWKLLLEPNALLYLVESQMYRVVTTFYAHLGRFSYKKEVAELLERFTAFCQ